MADSHIEHTSCSVEASSHINYLLLNLWCRRFIGRFEIPKSPSQVECEVLGTPVPQNVFIEPHVVSPVGTFWFWIGHFALEERIRFLLEVKETHFNSKVYVRAYATALRTIAAADSHTRLEQLQIQRNLSDRFQVYLKSHLEVDLY